MSISIEFKDKYVYFGPEAGLHTQGEARAEVYDVTGPRYHDGHDLSAMTWYVRASHPDYMTIINKRLRVSVAPGNEEQIIITWPVDADFTAYSGSLDVQFVAKSSTGEEIIKLQSNGLQLAASVEGTVIPPRNMFEAAVEQIEQLADDAANAAAQSKLEADRAEDSQKAAAQSAQQAQKSVQDMQQSVKDAAELVKQIEGDAESAAASASDAAENASISKDWAAGKPVTYSGAPVSIAYAGAQRIASITAYGETPQGGTTEAPVALTGISSVTVNDDVTELPIPRPLHKVGDVRDVCRTRVKSSYDKRIVLSSADGFAFSNNAGNGYARFYKAYNSARLSPIASNWLHGYAKTAYNATNEGVYSADSDAGAISIVLSIKRLTAAGATSGDTSTYLTAASAIFAATPLTVYYQSTDYNGTNGLDVCLMKYQTGFVELDGTENWVQATGANAGYLEAQVLKNTNESHLAVSSIAPFKYQFAGNCVFVTNNKVTFGSALGSDYTVDTWKAYLAAQKEAGTPVQVAYQLAAPEVYATDPVDFDNSAGPITVMTGGELEVRMTELIGSRSDVSNNTVAFTETAQDADIASGEKLSVLFGKIKKRFSVVNKLVNGAVYPNLGTNTNFSNPINQRGAASYTTATEAHMYCIDRWRILKNTTYTVASFTLTATSYAARACGMWQSNEMGAHQLSIGDDVTVSIYANGKLHTPTMKVIDRDLYDAFANVPASYDCDDFEIVLCTYAGDNTMYNLGIYPKKPLTVNYIKWEKGSIATPYVPKGYGAELVECYRYFWISSMPVNIFKTTAGDYFRNTVYFPIAMRTVPSVTILSSNGTVSINAVTIDAVKFAGNGGNDTVTSFSASADL